MNLSIFNADWFLYSSPKDVQLIRILVSQTLETESSNISKLYIIGNDITGLETPLEEILSQEKEGTMGNRG